MEPSEIIYPPIEYLFMRNNQQSEQAWQAIEQFGRQWNATHQNQLTPKRENVLHIILPGGINDPELAAFDAALTPLKTTAGVHYVRGMVDKRKPEDFEKAPWVQIVGDQYPLSAYENYAAVFSTPGHCENCGTPLRTGSLSGEPLIVDESVLDKKVEGLPHYDPPGLDLINLPNGAFLVSARVAELLTANNISGYELVPVISGSTRQPSQRLFLLKANKAIPDACDVHTPRDPGAICPVCGRVRIGVLGNFYVRTEWLNGDELFSRNPSRLSAICVSNRLYKLLKEMGCKGMLPAYGIFSCDHTK